MILDFTSLLMIIGGFVLMCVQHATWNISAEWMGRFQWSGSVLQEAYVPVENSMDPQLKQATDELRQLN